MCWYCVVFVLVLCCFCVAYLYNYLIISKINVLVLCYFCVLIMLLLS